jgi:hypothetical protein
MTSNSSTNSQPQHLSKWIKTQADLQKLAPLLAELAVFQTELDKAHPLLMLRAVSLKEDQLVVATPSPSVAAKLRQSAPSLLAAINAASADNPATRGRKVNRIRFKPQMGFGNPKGIVAAKSRVLGANQRTPNASSNLRIPTPGIALAQDMIEHCTNDKLKFALTRLIAAQRRLPSKPVG